MSKIAVVYWTGTGNTQTMAEAVAEGVKNAGSEAVLINASDFNAAAAESYDGYAFGCPAMGAEELESDEFDPMFSSVENALGAKKTGLFGSYGWGDGEWMRSWEDRCKNDGISLVSEGVICMETPDDDALSQCRELGKQICE